KDFSPRRSMNQKECDGNVRERGSREWCARFLILRCAGGARARILPEEKKRAARGQRPFREFAARIRRARRWRWRSNLLPRWSRGSRPCGANLLRSGGFCAKE